MLGAFPSKAHFFTKIRNIFLITFISSSFNFSNPVLRFPKYFTSCIKNWRLRQASWCEHLSSGISCEFLQKYHIVENLWNVEFFFRSFKELFGYATLLCKTCTYCIYHKTKTAVVLYFVHCKKSAPIESHGLHLAKYYCTRIRIKFSSLWYLDPGINHGTYEASVWLYGNNNIDEYIADGLYVPGQSWYI